MRTRQHIVCLCCPANLCLSRGPPLGLSYHFHGHLCLFLNKLVKFVVVSTHKKRWVCKRMEENLLQRLKQTNLDSGEELEGEPPVQIHKSRVRAATRVIYEVDEPPARNVQQSGAASQGPTALSLLPLTYEWQRLDDVQFKGDRSRVSWWVISDVTQVLVTKLEGWTTSLTRHDSHPLSLAFLDRPIELIQSSFSFSESAMKSSAPLTVRQEATGITLRGLEPRVTVESLNQKSLPCLVNQPVICGS
ncbi:hypothetical protein PRUPE_1G153000 [Prunus persica]|uniref:Uncharacterized protein n=1 Tax=Prunus persica TaxID=3760 RepID=A0A251QY09_PRUPE|nr:hypothetical protein PRUPE_1G153000 [Prunus persica]